MHSVSDLTTFARKTKGDVPPSLVGASTTVVGSKMYLFGGRLVSLRKMVADLYAFDLETFIWEKIEPSPDEDIPGARYFHSADSWNNHLVIFGGMGYSESSTEELCVLADVRLFDLAARRWKPSLALQSPASNADLSPRARYAHLSSVTSDRLFIIGGQDLANVWLDDIHVFDLRAQEWVERKEYPRHCGTYRSVAISAHTRVRYPQEEFKGQSFGFLGPAGSRFRPEKGAPGPLSPQLATASNALVHLPYSTAPTSEFPNEIFLYSNYNFTDVKRELEVFTPMPSSDFHITDRSSSMTGTSLPPGLRFPTGAILGSHLIIAGTYLAHSYQSFSIWALDLVTMQWSRIDPGTTLSTGSWCRGVLWEEMNKFLIFGNRDGNLVEDYNRRLLSWDHVAYIDLEAFGIYQPPHLVLDISAQELGLAALEEQVLADFEVVCDDGRRIKCSRKALEDRWPWFKEQRKLYLEAAARALETLPGSVTDVPLPELPGALHDTTPRPDPRLTPRSFHISEPYPITLALLQYIYAQALITRLQHAPAVLSALLLLSSTYQLPHLEKLVKHAMHRALSPQTSVGVYEVATLCDCQSLQIRALKVVMSSSKQKPTPRTRPDRPDRGYDGSQDGGNGGNTGGMTRPRGMSDATRPRTADGGRSNGRLGAFSGAGNGANGYSTGTGRKLETADGPRSKFGSSDSIFQPSTAHRPVVTKVSDSEITRRLVKRPTTSDGVHKPSLLLERRPTPPRRGTVDDVRPNAEGLRHTGSRDGLRRFGSRDEIRRLGSRDELRRLGSQDELRRLGSRDDLQRLGSREDMRRLRSRDELRPQVTLPPTYEVEAPYISDSSTSDNGVNLPDPPNGITVIKSNHQSRNPNDGLGLSNSMRSTSSDASGRLKRLLRELEDVNVGVKSGGQSNGEEYQGWSTSDPWSASGSATPWTDSRVSHNDISPLQATPPSDFEDLYFATQPDLSPTVAFTPLTATPQSAFPSPISPLVVGQRGRSGTIDTIQTFTSTSSAGITSASSSTPSIGTRRRGFSDAAIPDHPRPLSPSTPTTTTLSRSNSSSGGVDTPSDHQTPLVPYLHRIDEKMDKVDEFYSEGYINTPSTGPVTPPLTASPKSSTQHLRSPKSPELSSAFDTSSIGSSGPSSPFRLSRKNKSSLTVATVRSATSSSFSSGDSHDKPMTPTISAVTRFLAQPLTKAEKEILKAQRKAEKEERKLLKEEMKRLAKEKAKMKPVQPAGSIPMQFL